MLLPPRDQREWDRAVDHSEGESLPPECAEVRDRAPRPALREEEGEQQGRRDDQPEHDHRRRLVAAHGDLDEHVRGAPEQGEGGDVRDVGARHQLSPEATPASLAMP